MADSKMQKHRTVLALVGTLILVGTTVVRDIEREPIKDKLDNLKNAILVYQSQNEVMHLTIRLVDFINETTTYIHNSYTTSGKQPKPEEVILFGLHTIDERVVEDQDIFDNVKSLLDALGEPEPETQEYKDYKDVTDGYGALLALLLKKQSDGTWNKFDSQSLNTLMHDFNGKKVPMSNRALTLGEKCLDLAQEQTQVLERRYSRLTHWFDALFGLGAIVNVVGIFAGAGAGTTE